MATPRPPSVCLRVMRLNYASFRGVMPLPHEDFERPESLDIAEMHGYDAVLEYPAIRRVPLVRIV